MALSGEASARLEPIGVSELFAGALRLVRAAWPQVLVLVVVFAGYGFVVDAISARLPAGVWKDIPLTAARFLIAYVTAALLLRSLVDPSSAMKIDAGLFVSAAILSMVGAALWLFRQAATGLGLTTRDNLFVMAQATTVLKLALGYLAFRIILWPTSRAVGRPELGWRQSWRLTRGAVLSYFVVLVLVALPLLLGPATLQTVFAFGGDREAFREVAGTVNILQRVAGQLIGATGYVLSAAIYVRRVREADRVGDVFA